MYELFFRIKLFILLSSLLSSNCIDGHFHETFPKSYGHIQQLQPSSALNVSSLDVPVDENDEYVTPIPDSFESIATTTTATISSDESLVENDAKHFAGQKSKIMQYVWTVHNFTDILNSDEELIFSPRFYLSEPGYRLQMLLIKNTTYSDMISYLGLFFRIVAGDYDSHVEWPYKYRTVLSVLKHEELDEWSDKTTLTNGTMDNNNEIVTKYNYTVIPNLDECRLRSAFLRPNSDIEYSSNTDGCGNRRHIPLSVLKSDRYLKNDTLILLLTVYSANDNDDEEKTFHKASMSMRYNELVSNYLWTIEQFNEKKNESVSNGKVVILNSEPFYTHPNGYLIQLFLTLLPKRSAFAISLAFVQGDHDRYLQWPFPYPFEMAIVDQSPDYWKRDLTIKVKPSKSDCGIEPFSQPGPQPEFCFLTIQSLQVLSLTHYNFLSNDTLKIRFTTRFERYSSRQRSSILLRNNRLVSEFNWLIPGLVARFQRYIGEHNNNPSSVVSNPNETSSNMLKTHRFVSDEFYTNGQGYLCQLVLTVSVRNLRLPSNRTFLYEQQQQQQQSQQVLLFSLELVIIEGEYDRFLEWPFSNAYELSIVGYKNFIDNNSTNDHQEQQLYFDKTESQMISSNSKLIVPLVQIENGLCSRESFQKPIKQNPPCGIKEFVQMDLSSSTGIDDEPMKPKAKELKNEDQTRTNYELGSLSKSDEDLHLRVRIYL